MLLQYLASLYKFMRVRRHPHMRVPVHTVFGHFVHHTPRTGCKHVNVSVRWGPHIQMLMFVKLNKQLR